MEIQNTGKLDIKSRMTRLLIGIKKNKLRLEDYETLKPIIEEFKLDKECKVLVLGCGNAEFSEDMYDEGYNLIYNIDISENVIKSMKERNTERNKMLCIFILKIR